MNETFWSAGHVIVGGVVSSGITLKVQEDVFVPSEAVRITAVEPVTGCPPAEGDWVIETEGSQLSVAVARPM